MSDDLRGYQLLEELGRGGQAVTWRARSPQGQVVALKLLHLAQLDDWKTLEQFEREAQALERLQHPQIPAYHEAFTQETAQGPSLVLVQDFVEGQDLTAELARAGRLSAPQVARDLAQVLEILIYLHKLAPPVIHRDIKPSNLLRRPDGSLCLIDFGAVRFHQGHTSHSLVIGTPGYMPMEQMVGRADARSDLYALGVTFGHLWSGLEPSRVSLRGGRLDFRAHIDDPSPALDVIEAMIQPDADQRPPSARAALERLRQVAPTAGSPRPAPTPPAPASPTGGWTPERLQRLLYRHDEEPPALDKLRLAPSPPGSFLSSLAGVHIARRSLQGDWPRPPWVALAERQGFTLVDRQTRFSLLEVKTRLIWRAPQGDVALILTCEPGDGADDLQGEHKLELVSLLEDGTLLRQYADADGGELDGHILLKSSGDLLRDLRHQREVLAQQAVPAIKDVDPDALLALYDPDWWDLPPPDPPSPKEESSNKDALLGLLALPLILFVFLFMAAFKLLTAPWSLWRQYDAWHLLQQEAAALPSASPEEAPPGPDALEAPQPARQTQGAAHKNL